jgi:hypothetical protein
VAAAAEKEISVAASAPEKISLLLIFMFVLDAVLGKPFTTLSLLRC